MPHIRQSPSDLVFEESWRDGRSVVNPDAENGDSQFKLLELLVCRILTLWHTLPGWS